MNQSTEPSTAFIPFAKPSLGREEEEAVLRIMRSGWLTTGAETLAFEKEFAAFIGSPHALAVNSATSGLHLALEALGIGPGDTVITSAYTFTSSAAVILHLGADVVFCDTAPDSYNMDPKALEKLLATTRNCRAIITVHIGGLPCDLDAILPLAARYGCAVIEDAAHAFPVHSGTAWAGTRGTIGVYSFYATKTITTGEGGMIVTADAKLAARMSAMRMHGIDREVWNRYTSKSASWRYSVTEAGYKYNMPDILAAIGRVQLGKALRFAEERTNIAKLYDEAFSGLPGLRLPPRLTAISTAGNIGHAWHLYSLRVGMDGNGPDRDQFVEALMQAGVGVSVHFIPLHIMPYYADRYKLKPEDLPNTLNIFNHTLSLPIWQGMTTTQASTVATTVRRVATEGADGQ
ncbi:MAG: DegT/DnrJ/EryC1/StrS aminotransferase family protein [Spirochaetes bacterium]|nr:DegT/DnrJ/EryC1/StrS aminotransferase family protein [Spirochaetota bacterium]MBU0954376.1 DegT/DnrJ/EryC1/StrS aminotransferase family protein [Spirochaetota bacterium]